MTTQPSTLVISSAKTNIFTFYWRLVFRPNLGQTLFALSLMFVAALMNMLVIGLVAPLLDVAMNIEKAAETTGGVTGKILTFLASIGIKDDPNQLILSMLLLVSLSAILYGLFNLFQRYQVARIREIIRRKVKVEMFEKVLGADYAEITKRNRGAIVYDLNQPPKSLERAITIAGTLTAALLSVGMVVALMFYISWWATLAIGMIGGGWFVLWRKLTDKRATHIGGKIYDLQTQTSKVEIDAVDGMKVVKAFGLHEALLNRQKGFVFQEMAHNLRLVLINQSPLVLNVILASLFVAGLAGLIYGWKIASLSFSQLVVFFMALKQISPFVASISSNISDLHREKKNIEAINSILKETPQEPEGLNKKLGAPLESVSFKNVSFVYQSKPDHNVLNNVSFDLKKGNVISFVGSTGAGKSTIANLIIGLYRPAKGTVNVNQENLKDLDLEAWREKIGYVGQDVYLFNASVKDNITLFNTAISQAEIEEAAKVAQLHDFVTTMSHGYNTVVGDRGLKLSGGQAQRLSIARALLRKPELIIFDEATSALDNLTEKAIYKTIDTLHNKAIVVVISHRLNTVRDADKIYVLEKGKIVQEGKHDGLINQSGLYSTLYKSEASLAHAGQS